MKNSTLNLTIMAALFFAPSALGLDFIFETIPSNGQVLALPGDTAGWGYRIENPTVDWLELTNLSSDVFLIGIPTVLFDFPILAPGENRVVPWIIGTEGLFEVTWDPLTPLGFSNSGQFVVEGVFWDANPLSPGANVIADADPQTASYLAIADIPEPGVFWLVAPVLPLFGILMRRLHAR